jgi:hypothetical protein
LQKTLLRLLQELYRVFTFNRSLRQQNPLSKIALKPAKFPGFARLPHATVLEPKKVAG